jgi:branched-chain amino acid transport system substrate-binding protein
MIAALASPWKRRLGARHVLVAGLLAAVVPLSGCGTRMSSEAIEAADGSALSAQAATGNVAASAGAGSDLGAPVAAGGEVAPVPGAPAAAGGNSGPAAAPASGSTAGGTKSGGNSTGATGTATVPTGPNAPCKQSLAPIVLGQTGAFSGIIGSPMINVRTGIALWSRAVNAAGGVQCHPVQVIQMDDGADPARVSSNLSSLKSKGVVAMIAVNVPTTFSAAKRFAEQHKMPIIGGDLIETPWYSSPWFFPQGGGPLASYAGAIKQAALKANTKKVGLIYCVEAAICGTINQNFDAMAKLSGLEVVVRKVSSITSPDYTAECQALKAAGAEAIFVALEGSGDARFARSCLSLGYSPPTATSALSVNAEAAQDANFRKLGVFLGTPNAPYLAEDTAGVKAFQTAYNRFAAGSMLDQNLISGWAAGKLFEKALSHVADQARAGAVTTEVILDGLWRIKNEKLDGLSSPITFNKNAPPDPNDCYALLNLTTTGYSAPLGSKFECFKGLPKGF